MENLGGKTQMEDFVGKTPSWMATPEKIAPEMVFERAAQLFIAAKTLYVDGHRAKGYIRERTEITYRADLNSLGLFFRGMKLCDIRLDHLAKYQRLRIAGAEPFLRYRRPQDAKARVAGGLTIAPKGKSSCPAKPHQVNRELTVLISILKKANLWSEDNARLYEPLIETITELPRALRPQEQRRWLEAARSNPRWELVFWWSMLAFDTCMSSNEIRSLRLGDLNLQQGVITVPREGAKNVYRHRTIRIAGPEALWALEQLLVRSRKLGARDPQHYLFPFRITRKKDARPDRPMTVSGLKKLWQEVRDASGLTWFRMYDTRHTAITRLAEAGVPIATIMKRAGHSNPKMTDHYTHISDQSEADAVRRAQRYQGGFGAMLAADSSNERTAVAPERVGEMVRSLQDQLGPEGRQVLIALMSTLGAQTVPR